MSIASYMHIMITAIVVKQEREIINFSNTERYLNTESLILIEVTTMITVTVWILFMTFCCISS